MSSKNKKIIIGLFLLFFIFSIISSSFIAYNTSHINYCHKENCNTCNIIVISKYFLTNLIIGFLIYLIKIKYIKLIFYQKKIKKYIRFCLNTLIELKIQFNT